MTRGANYDRPNWIESNFATRAGCGHDIIKGEQITFRPSDRRTWCNACSHARALEISEARRTMQYPAWPAAVVPK